MSAKPDLTIIAIRARLDSLEAYQRRLEKFAQNAMGLHDAEHNYQENIGSITLKKVHAAGDRLTAIEQQIALTVSRVNETENRLDAHVADVGRLRLAAIERSLLPLNELRIKVGVLEAYIAAPAQPRNVQSPILPNTLDGLNAVIFNEAPAQPAAQKPLVWADLTEDDKRHLCLDRVGSCICGKHESAKQHPAAPPSQTPCTKYSPAVDGGKCMRCHADEQWHIDAILAQSHKGQTGHPFTDNGGGKCALCSEPGREALYPGEANLHYHPLTPIQEHFYANDPNGNLKKVVEATASGAAREISAEQFRALLDDINGQMVDEANGNDLEIIANAINAFFAGEGK